MRFGPLVLGPKAFEKEQEAYKEAASRAFVYGPLVANTPPAAGTDQKQEPAGVTAPAKAKPAEPEPTQPTVLSLKELREALQEDVSEALLDKLIAAEFERAEGAPRKGALRLLLDAELARGEAARTAIVKELEKALEA